MKIIFMDIDGVLNSRQSFHFWHKMRTEIEWEEDFKSFKGSLKEFLVNEFDPIALSNMETLITRVPDVKVVVSSSWRIKETTESLKQILSIAPVIANAVIDVTPRFHRQPRGAEIDDWLVRHPHVTNYVIIDDSSDMLPSQSENFVHTSELHGFQWGDMLWAERILNK